MKNSIYILIVFLVVFVSCTDLEPVLYSEISNENFFKTEEQVLSFAGPAYQAFNATTNPTCLWGLYELTTDEFLLPTRGIHWDNDGIYRRMHKHEWLPTSFIINYGWTVPYAGINKCNNALAIYEGIEEKSDALLSIIEELKVLRGFYYFYLMDLFGNVPIVDTYDVPEGFAPTNNSRAEVFEFVENALLDGIPELTTATDMTAYARINKYVAYAIQAKLYLNAEVYIGETHWDEVITACDSIINCGGYSLEDDYFSNFAIENESSGENLFVIPYSGQDEVNWGDETYSSRMFNLHVWTLHFNGTFAYGCEQGGWNGFCAVPSFYYLFDEDDIRRDGLVTGLQTKPNGDTLYCNTELAGQPLIYTVEITSLEGAYENEGARFVKYDYTDSKNYQLANDYVVFRYADILLMKAEALMRKNGGTATVEAVDLVNQVRARAFPGDDSKLYTTSTLTLEELLAERGRELYGEGWRRNDLIRFGKFNDACDFRPAPVSDIYNLYPIPQDQINANPNLVQNPGY